MTRANEQLPPSCAGRHAAAVLAFSCITCGSPPPVDDRLSNIVEIQVFDGAACARDTAGDVYCWGDPHAADVPGRANPTEGKASARSNRPRRIHGATRITRLGSKRSAFGYATAVRDDGEIVTWSRADLRPFVEIGRRADEKQEPEDFMRVVPRDGRVWREGSVGDDPWRARPTGVTVADADLFADTGCFYGGGVISCPGVVSSANVASYDALEWAHEPGVVDVAIFDRYEESYSDRDRGVCLHFIDGRLECRVGGKSEAIRLPSEPVKLFGGRYVTALLKDGHVATSVDGRAFVNHPDAENVTDLDVASNGVACGLLRGGGAACWPMVGGSWEELKLVGVEDATSIQISDLLTWCVTDSTRHVKCGGWNAAGECGIGLDSERLERAEFVVAPSERE